MYIFITNLFKFMKFVYLCQVDQDDVLNLIKQ